MISEHAVTFAGKPVEDFNPAAGISDPVNVAYALRVGWEEEDIETKLQALLQDPRIGQLEALVIGTWSDEVYTKDSSEIVRHLTAARDKLANLKALFLGDIMYEESEISWIQQSDVGPLLMAYPQLKVFQVRGGEHLAFKALQHNALKQLVVQTGGLNPRTIADICSSRLPQLEHLELWLGSDSYGGDSTVDDLRPILAGNLFPRLVYLGLCDSEYADDIAKAVVTSPLLNQLKTLDLSMGILSDEGAEVLRRSPEVARLNTLNVSKNYLSPEMVQRLSELACRVVADDQKEADKNDDWRYVSVAE